MKIHIKTLLFICLTIFLASLTIHCGSNFAIAQDEDAGPKRIFSAEEMKKIEATGQNILETGWRANGGNYFNLITIIVMIIFYWLWTVTTSWANTDAERLGDPDRVYWNTILVSVFPLVFFLSLLIPLWIVPLLLIPLAYFVPTFMYVSHRNTGMLAADKVMTPSHISFIIKRLCGIKIKEKKQAYEVGPPIQLVNNTKTFSTEEKNGRTILARNTAGYNTLRTIVYNSMQRKATAIAIEFGQEETLIYFMLDGVWHQIDNIFKYPLKREEADPLQETAKILVGANPQDRRSHQQGDLIIDAGKKNKIPVHFVSQGAPTGEKISLSIVSNGTNHKTLAELGLSQKRQMLVKELMKTDHGLLVFSALNGQGLKTLTNVSVLAADRFTRDFSTVEDVQNPYPFLENVQLNTYDSADGKNPMDILPDVFFREPKVLLIRDMINTEAFSLCCQEIENDRFIITTFRAKDSVETLLKMLQTGIDPKLLADSLQAIITQKLIRNLCKACREKIPANPLILQKLGLQPGSVKYLYRKRVRPVVEQGQKDTYVPCSACQEIGYDGRSAILDILFINDDIRQVMMTHPSAEALRQVAARNGQRGYLEDGSWLVSKGHTSFDELVRILK
ncbi:MAG: ATPase, T2SS/T4P/T4SS family [Planctomycetia bacterium]|nr:ATPase, T2SS/T4P/T4SS family [Planctomycetia bacterium]